MSSIKKNMMYAMSAQIITLALSLLTSIIVPKFMGKMNFGYWQLYLFYMQYVGFFHLGWQDGIYLKNGGKYMHDLDKKSMSAQYVLSNIVFAIVGIAIFLFAQFMIEDSNKVLVITMVSIGMFATNMHSFVNYIFQTTNHIKEYSIAAVIEKVFFMIGVAMLLFLKTGVYFSYIFLLIIAKFISYIYLMYKGRKILFPLNLSIKKGDFKEVLYNIVIGFPLLIANIMSLLILGVARFFIEQHFGIISFSEFSFAVSLTNVFLIFMSQASLVLFPVISRLNKDKIREMFTNLGVGISLLMCGALALYPVGYYILSSWLPQYKISLYYLIMLLPICLYDGKMKMLYNSYLKSMRKERMLLVINIISVIISVVGSLVGTYIFESIFIVMAMVVTAIILRSLIAYFYIIKVLDLEFDMGNIFELGLIVTYVILMYSMDMIYAMIIYIILYLLYVIYNRDNIRKMIRR